MPVFFANFAKIYSSIYSFSWYQNIRIETLGKISGIGHFSILYAHLNPYDMEPNCASWQFLLCYDVTSHHVVRYFTILLSLFINTVKISNEHEQFRSLDTSTRNQIFELKSVQKYWKNVSELVIIHSNISTHTFGSYDMGSVIDFASCQLSQFIC